MADTETDETHELIASNKVEGTNVYGHEGEHLGSIYNVMIDKVSGQVEFAVLQFGGVLGIGSDYYPVLWTSLEYSADEGGYVIDIDKEFLQHAPKYSAGAEPPFTPDYSRQIDDIYGVEVNEEMEDRS